MMSKKKRADITALYETHRKPNVVPESLAQLPESSVITFTLFSCVKKTFRLSGCSAAHRSVPAGVKTDSH